MVPFTPPKYREDKTTQAASILLQLSNRSLNVMKLIKLLYFCDRESLLTCGRPITFDWYLSMDHGPVLSFTLNKINASKDLCPSSYWHKYISERYNNEVKLTNNAPKDQLSKYEENLIGNIWKKYGHLDQFKISNLSHELPEWKDPKGSRLPIKIEDILESGDFSDDDITDILESLELERLTKELLCE